MEVYDEKTEAEPLVTLSLLECDIAITIHINCMMAVRVLNTFKDKGWRYVGYPTLTPPPPTHHHHTLTLYGPSPFLLLFTHGTHTYCVQYTFPMRFLCR